MCLKICNFLRLNLRYIVHNVKSFLFMAAKLKEMPQYVASCFKENLYSFKNGNNNILSFINISKLDNRLEFLNEIRT